VVVEEAVPLPLHWEHSCLPVAAADHSLGVTAFQGAVALAAESAQCQALLQGQGQVVRFQPRQVFLRQEGRHHRPEGRAAATAVPADAWEAVEGVTAGGVRQPPRCPPSRQALSCTILAGPVFRG